jgi:hypothetical protein
VLNEHELVGNVLPAFVRSGESLGGNAWAAALRDPANAREWRDALGVSISGGFGTAFAENRSIVDFSKTFSSLEKLGFNPSCAGLSPAVESALVASFARLKRDKKPMINLPAETTPASSILADVSRIDSASLFRSARSFVDRGGLSQEALERIWPRVGEKKVASLLVENIRGYDYTSARRDYLSMGRTGVEWQVRFGDLSAFADSLIPDGRTSDKVMKFLRVLDVFNHHHEKNFARLKVDFPSQWNAICEKLGRNAKGYFAQKVFDDICAATEKDLVCHLYGDSTPERVYRSLRWLSAELIEEQVEDQSENRKDMRWKSPFFLYEPESLEARAFSRHMELRNAFEQLVEDRDDGESPFPLSAELRKHFRYVDHPEFKELTERERAAAIISCFFKVNESGHFVGIDSFARWAIPASLVRGIEGVIRRYNKEANKQVWDHLFAYDAKAMDISKVFKQAEEKVHIALRDKTSMNSVYARFLYDRVGRITPVSPAGDFESLRQYTHGDDMRMVDWRASARRGEMMVKQKRDREIRPVYLVADVEWLLEGVEYDSIKNTVIAAPRLEELFTHLLLAEKQKVGMQIVVVSRTALGRFENLVDVAGGKSRFREESFSKELSRLIKGAKAVIEGERQVYGENGYPPVNVFAALDAELPKNAMVIAGLARKNIAPVLPAIEAYRQRGRLVYVSRS